MAHGPHASNAAKKREGQHLGKGPIRARQDEAGTQQLLTAMARLEDELNSRAQEMEFMVFTQSGEKGLVPTLVAVSQAWHQKAEQANERSLLRIVMLASFIKQLEFRSAKVISAGVERPTAAGGAHEDWPAHGGRAGLEPNAVVQGEGLGHALLQEVHGLVQKPGVILRFYAMKSLQQVEAKDGSVVVAWKLVIALRAPEATLLYNHVMRLSHSAIAQLVMARVRPATQRRSPLAQHVSQLLA